MGAGIEVVPACAVVYQAPGMGLFQIAALALDLTDLVAQSGKEGPGAGIEGVLITLPGGEAPIGGLFPA